MTTRWPPVIHSWVNVLHNPMMKVVSCSSPFPLCLFVLRPLIIHGYLQTTHTKSHKWWRRAQPQHFNSLPLKVTPEESCITVCFPGCCLWMVPLKAAERHNPVLQLQLCCCIKSTTCECQRPVPVQALVCFSLLGLLHRGKFSLLSGQCPTQHCLVMPTVPQAWSPFAHVEMESTRWLLCSVVLADAQRWSRLPTERRWLFLSEAAVGSSDLITPSRAEDD